MSSAYPGSRITAGTLLRGYIQAVDRFSGAIRDRAPEPNAFALFEALNWAVALDDYVRDVWKPGDDILGHGWRVYGGGEDLPELLGATRYARNLVHHHWADALVNRSEARFPMTFPIVFHSWVWRSADELPPHPGTDKKPHVIRNRTAYEKRMSGQLAEASFLELRQTFEGIWRFLDPPRPVLPPGGPDGG